MNEVDYYFKKIRSKSIEGSFFLDICDLYFPLQTEIFPIKKII